MSDNISIIRDILEKRLWDGTTALGIFEKKLYSNSNITEH